MVKLSRVDLNLLVAFDALMNERSVSRAAEQVNVGQPAMSAALARLRKLFDDPVLVREGNAWVATPTAENLIVPIHEGLQLIASALETRRSFVAETDSRTFTVIASDYVLLTLLQPLFSSLETEAPHVRLNVKPVGQDYADQLRRGVADLLILPRETAGERGTLASSDLFTDRYVCAVDAAHPDVGEQITLQQFTELPYLAYSGGPLQSVVQAQLESIGLARTIEVTTQIFTVVPFLLAGTRLVALIHERLARQVAVKANLKVLEPPMALSPLTEAMYWSPRHTADPGHRWFRQRLATAARGM